MERDKISFDYDGTLDDHFDGQININKQYIQDFFVELCNKGDLDIYIITRRYGQENAGKGSKNEHIKVMELLNKLNIELPKENILFTNRDYKYSLIERLGIKVHLDDDIKEHELIQKFTNRSSVDITKPNWKSKFDELL